VADFQQPTPTQRRRQPKTRRYLAGLSWWLMHSWRYRAAWGVKMRQFL